LFFFNLFVLRIQKSAKRQKRDLDSYDNRKNVFANVIIKLVDPTYDVIPVHRTFVNSVLGMKTAYSSS